MDERSEEKAPRRPVTTVETAIKLLQTLAENNAMNLTELANATGFAESTTHRHLATLVDTGLVIRDGNTYRLSFWFLDVGTRRQHSHPLYIVGQEYVDDLASETGERVWLSTIENGRSVSLYWASDRSQLRQHSRIGTRHHLHVSSVGKAMLAELSDSAIEDLIEKHGLPARTTQTISDREKLFEELEMIRDLGYAVSSGETVDGMDAVAVSISDEVTGILGAMGIGCSSSRMDTDLVQEFADKLQQTADEMAIRTRFS
jgi:DNA-binding IclR family transcriptional regulator